MFFLDLSSGYDIHIASLPWKIHPFFRTVNHGKPSISMGHIFFWTDKNHLFRLGPSIPWSHGIPWLEPGEPGEPFFSQKLSHYRIKPDKQHIYIYIYTYCCTSLENHSSLLHIIIHHYKSLLYITITHLAYHDKSYYYMYFDILHILPIMYTHIYIYT